MILLYIFGSIVSLLILRLLFFIIRSYIYYNYVYGWVFCPHCHKRIKYKVKLGETPYGECKCGALWII